MSRGRLNIATCLVTGSIETVIIVSVLWPPPLLVGADQQDVQAFLAVPRRDRRTVGTRRAESASVPRSARRRRRRSVSRARSRPGVGDASAARRSRRRCPRRRRCSCRGRPEREQVVAGDDDVGAGHDEHHRQQPGDRQRVARHARLVRAGRRRRAAWALRNRPRGRHRRSRPGGRRGATRLKTKMAAGRRLQRTAPSSSNRSMRSTNPAEQRRRAGSAARRSRAPRR